jgi:magnesium chelatase family protein
MLVAASNPCPCGTDGPACRCAAADLARYERKLSGPLLDRIDIAVRVGRPSAETFRAQTAPTSAATRELVAAARERQARRLRGTGARCNAHMTPAMLRELAAIAPSARRLLFELHDPQGLSARGHHRVLRVARTLADLEDSREVGPEHITAALALRSDGPQIAGIAA